MSMKRSTDHLLTTHTGSLPRPEDLVEMILATAKGDQVAGFDPRLTDAVNDVVRHQLEVGLDVVNDGEQGKITYYTYITDRLTGFEGELPAVALADVLDFPDFYKRVWWASEEAAQNVQTPACNGPIKVKSLEGLYRDIRNLKDASEASGAPEAFMTAVSPGLIAAAHGNQYYDSREEFLAAIGEAMREEYEAIAAAGFILQLDCPDLAMAAHLYFRDESIDAFKRLSIQSVEALNHATRHIDPDRMRLHLCWGNYEGPHHKDIELDEIIDIVLRARPNGLLVEAANPRHEHEWRVFENHKLPEGKILIPGVIDSTTNYIEHPEVVAQRLLNYARVVGGENLIAGTDCGFGTAVGLAMVDPKVAWAKLRSLAEGARLASRALGLARN
jgi:5-methyltetrahydropteroyltriglutamate--homocysteine methyltransferase